MASLVLGVAGAAAGFAIGGPTGAQVGFMLGSMLGGSLSTLPDVNGARLNDLKVQGSSYGAMIPVYYGTYRGAGNLIWSTDLVETKHSEDAGGKGGPSQTVNSYTYSVNCAISLCEGPISGIRRVWANGELILDKSDTNTGATGETAGMRIYLGDETQVADSLIESYLGAGNVPAYRGQAYVVFENFELEKYGNRIPSFSFEVVKDGVETLGLATYAPNTFRTTFLAADAPMLGNNIWIFEGTESIGASGWARNILSILDVSTGLKQDMYDVTENGAFLYAKYSAGAFIGTVIISGVPYELNEIWFAANDYAEFIYVHDALTGALKRKIPQTTDWQAHIWYCEYLQRMVTVSNNITNDLKFYDPLTDINAFTIAAPANGNNILRGNKASNMLGIISQISSNFYVYDLDTLALRFSMVMQQTSLGAICFDTKRQCMIAVASNTAETKYQFHIVNADFSYSLIEQDKVSGFGIAQITYHPTVDKFMVFGGVAGSGFRAILNADTFNIEYSYLTASSADDWNIDLINAVSFDRQSTGDLIAVGSGEGKVATMPYDTRMSSNGVALSSIVADLCNRVTLSAGDIDVAALTDIVDGYVVAQQMSARAAIEGLQSAYYFDVVESD